MIDKKTFAAVLAVALLAPVAAAADPVTAWVATTLSVSSTTAAFIVRTALSLTLSALSAAMKKRQEGAQRPPGIKTDTTTTGGTVPQSFILGKYATAGNMAAPPYSEPNDGYTPNLYLHYVVDISDMPGVQLSRVMVNGEYVDLTAKPDGIQFDYEGMYHDGKPYFRLKWHDGSQTEADARMMDRFANHPERPWSADMVGAGITYAVAVFRFKRKIFNQLPAIRFEVFGIPLYDPRKDSSAGGSGAHRWSDPTTWEYTENPVVMIYNVLRGITLPDGSRWGGSVPAADLPLDNWFTAMNECDVAVPLADGGAEPQYRAGLEVAVDEEPAAVIDLLLNACSGEIAEVGGVYKIRVGPPALPVYFFSDDDVAADHPQSLAPYPGLDGVHNAIHASYPSPAALWENRDAPPRYNAEWEAEDGGRQLVAEVDLPAVWSGTQVQRLMQAWIEDERRFRRHSLTLPPDAAILEPLDTVSWTSAREGYTSKVFEVGEVSDDLVTCLQTVAIRERDAGDFSWDPLADEVTVPDPSPLPVVPAPRTVPGFALTAHSVEDGTGAARRPALRLSWDAALLAEGDVLVWRVQLADGTPVAGGVVAEVTDGEQIVSDGILPGTAYRAKMKVRSQIDGDWTGWAAATTADLRITDADLSDTLDSRITSAQDAADGAVQAASDAADAASGVRTDFDALTIGYTGGALQDALDSARADANAYTDARETALGVRIDNAAASNLPSGFDGDGQYWTSTITGAPGAYPLDSAWTFSTGAKEGRAAGMVLDGHSGQASKMFTRGLETPTNGRKYRVTVRCAFFGTVTSGTPRFEIGVKHLGTDYAYLNNQDQNSHTLPADNTWREYTFEVEAGDTNTAPYWRIGFSLRTDLFTGTGTIFFSKVLFEDITDAVMLEAQINTLDVAITGPDGAIAASEKTLRVEAENVAAAALPYDFAEDGTYWTSTMTGAPGAYPLDSRWSFANGANEGRKAVVAAADYNGNFIWMMTRGTLVPTRGRRYRITVRCRLQGTVSGGPHLSIFFRALDSDYQNPAAVGFSSYPILNNAWTDYVMEVDCTSSNVSAHWRAGFYVRGTDFTGDGNFEVSKPIVQDITDQHQLGGQITDLQALDVDALSGTAFGVLLQQFQVDAGGTSAVVTSQGNAIADLEGNASAGYLIKAQAGEAVSLLDLIAADGSEGSVSVAKLQAQDIILEGSVSMNMLTAGTGKNLLENSDFLHGETSLVFYEFGAVSNGGRGEIRDDDSLFSTPFYPTARLISLAASTTDSGWVGVDFRPTNPDGTLGVGYAVIPGDFYEFHAAMNLRRVKASVRLYWYKSDGTACLDGSSNPVVSYLDAAEEPNLTGNGLSIGEWPRFGGIGQAPGDAAYVVPSIRLIEVVATGANQDVHIVWPMFCRTETADAPLSPYAPGGVTLIHGNRVVTGSINAEFSVTAGTITADLFAANIITTDIITITGYLDMDAVNTGMRIGKQSVVDSSDGAYFGRTEIDGNTGFGFYIGRTTGGVEQHIRMTEQDGLEIKNAEFMLGSSTASRTTYTSSTTYTIPAGTERISFAFVGGGGGGQGGGVEGGVGSPGSNGANTIVTLKDGTTTVATWTAAGGQGGPGPEDKTTAYSPYGNGGAGGQGAQGNSDTASGKDGASGDGGAVTTITNYDVSGLSNPKLEITIGNGGNGGGNGGDGNDGFAEVTAYGTGAFPAGPVARQQAAAGTVSCPAGTDTLFPALGSPGFWQVWGGSIGVYAEIDDDGGTTLISTNGTSSFFSARNRPKVLSPGSSVNLTYRFWPMG